jgi:hypothetical protein
VSSVAVRPGYSSLTGWTQVPDGLDKASYLALAYLRQHCRSEQASLDSTYILVAYQMAVCLPSHPCHLSLSSHLALDSQAYPSAYCPSCQDSHQAASQAQTSVSRPFRRRSLLVRLFVLLLACHLPHPSYCLGKRSRAVVAYLPDPSPPARQTACSHFPRYLPRYRYQVRRTGVYVLNAAVYLASRAYRRARVNKDPIVIGRTKVDER